jgi:small subunit ribosomal protein S20
LTTLAMAYRNAPFHPDRREVSLANTASAEKRNRQAQKRRARNVQVRTGVKSAVKKVRDAVARSDGAGAKDALHAAEKTIGKAASKGVLHRNAASRKISRLAKAAARAAQAPKQA